MDISKQKKGFTIVELLIVIVVISILASVILLASAGMTGRTKNVTRVDSARKALNLMRVYTAANGGAALRATMTTDYMCIGTDYVDLDPGYKACGIIDNSVYVQDQAPLNAALSTVGSNRTNYPTLDAINGIRVQSSAPYYKMLTDSNLYVNNAPGKFGQLTYYLEGSNQDCILTPQLKRISGNATRTDYQTTNEKNSGYNTAFTSCSVYYFPE